MSKKLLLFIGVSDSKLEEYKRKRYIAPGATFSTHKSTARMQGKNIIRAPYSKKYFREHLDNRVFIVLKIREKHYQNNFPIRLSRCQIKCLK